jgi:N6-L-threonylcarbamoyladenine synthase
MSYILGIETSCDDTAASVMTSDGKVLSNVLSSQNEFHARYGGIVPEIASRKHLELISLVVKDALDRAGISLDQL